MKYSAQKKKTKLPNQEKNNTKPPALSDGCQIPDADDLTDMLVDPVEMWLHGVALMVDSAPVATCSLCAAGPGPAADTDAELLACCDCGDRYHMYCVEPNNVPGSEQDQLAWRCRHCLTEPIDCSHPETEGWSHIPVSPAPPTSPLLVTSPPFGPSSPAILQPLTPYSYCWYHPETPLPPVTSPKLPFSYSWSLDSPNREPTSLKFDRSDLESPLPTAPIMKLTLEELMADGGKASDDIPNMTPQTVGAPCAEQKTSTMHSTEDRNDLSTQCADTTAEDGDDFKGFTKSELHEQVHGEQLYRRRGQRGPEAPKKGSRSRRPRHRKCPRPNVSYNLRRSHSMITKSYRQTRTRRKTGERGYICKEGNNGQMVTDPQSKVQDQLVSTSQSAHEGAPPAFYIIPLQYQVMDVTTAMGLLRGSPTPESSGDALQATGLGYSAASDCSAGWDLLESLHQTVQEELDLLGYPSPLPSVRSGLRSRRRAPLKAIPDCMPEGEWLAWRRLMPPRRGRPRKYPRPDDLSWIFQIKKLGVRVTPVVVSENNRAAARRPRPRLKAAARSDGHTVTGAGSARRHRLWRTLLRAPADPVRHLPGRQGRRRLTAVRRDGRRRGGGEVPPAAQYGAGLPLIT